MQTANTEATDILYPQESHYCCPVTAAPLRYQSTTKTNNLQTETTPAADSELTQTINSPDYRDHYCGLQTSEKSLGIRLMIT